MQGYSWIPNPSYRIYQKEQINHPVALNTLIYPKHLSPSGAGYLVSETHDALERFSLERMILQNKQESSLKKVISPQSLLGKYLSCMFQLHLCKYACAFTKQQQ